MPRYRFAVEYFGAPFAGWQVQDNAVTVQGELERALATVLRQPVRVTGAGRTDAGVHARGQVAHFDFEGDLDLARLTPSMNALAGPHICVRGLEPCPPEFHARYSALSRRYRYRIALRPIALLRHLCWVPHFPLDVNRLRSELLHTLGEHDFLNFSVPRDDGKSTQCQVLRAEVEERGACLHIHLEANRFLHKMVRSLVGAAVEVARGKQNPGLIPAIFAHQFEGERLWAPAEGLCLEQVAYPDYAV